MAERPEHKKKPTRRVWIARAVRLVVVLAAVAWLYKHNDWTRLRQVLTKADWRLAALGLLAQGPVAALFGLRLRWLLVVHDIHISYWKALKVTFIGNFLIHALPVGTSGGDAAKAWYVARDTPHKHEAVMSVFFDRVVGVAGLLLLSSLMVVLNWHNPAMTHWAKPIGLAVAVLAVCAGLYFSPAVRACFRLEQIIARLPLAAHLQRMDQAIFAFRHHRSRLVACLALTVALQVCAVVSTYLCGWALDLVGGNPWKAFPLYLAYTPIAFLSGALPLGAMEFIYVQLFTPGLGPPEAAFSLSLLSRLMQLIWALPGGLAVLKGQVELHSAPPTGERVPSETGAGTSRS